MIKWATKLKEVLNLIPEDPLGAYYSIFRRSLVATIAVTGISKTHSKNGWLRLPLLISLIPAISFFSGWRYGFTGLMVGVTTFIQDKYPNATKLILSNTLRQVFTTWRLTKLAIGAGSHLGAASVIGSAIFAIYYNTTNTYRHKLLSKTDNELTERSKKGKKRQIIGRVGTENADKLYKTLVTPQDGDFRSEMKASRWQRAKASFLALMEYWNAFILTGKIKGKVDPWLAFAVGLSWYNNYTNPTLNTAEKQERLRDNLKKKSKYLQGKKEEEIHQLQTSKDLKFDNFRNKTKRNLKQTAILPTSSTNAKRKWQNAIKYARAQSIQPSYNEALKEVLFGNILDPVKEVSKSFADVVLAVKRNADGKVKTL